MLLAAHTCGAVSQAEMVALESLGRIWLSRAPRIMFEDLLGTVEESMDSVPAYFLKVTLGAESAPGPRPSPTAGVRFGC